MSLIPQTTPLAQKKPTALYSLSIIGLILFINACSRYEVSVNERIVYTPPPLFTQYRIPDTALSKCIAETIITESISDPKKLKILFCTDRGIASLEGLEQFPNIQQLGLAQNSLRNVQILTQLKELKQLDLDNNNIKILPALNELKQLKFLSLIGNTTLSCPPLETLRTTATLKAPNHCQK